MLTLYAQASNMLITSEQRRIFIFGALGYFKLGARLEVLRRLLSYQLALHVLVTFTEQVVPPVLKHITLFWIPSIMNKNSHNENNEKGSGEVIWPHPMSLLSTSLASCHAIWKMDSGVLFHTLYATITNFQRHKKRMLIAIHSILALILLSIEIFC